MDDRVDVFAWREQRDELPGFLLAAAQVATGGDWKDKSILSHIDHVFPRRWFKRPPVTRMVPYTSSPSRARTTSSATTCWFSATSCTGFAFRVA